MRIRKSANLLLWLCAAFFLAEASADICLPRNIPRCECVQPLHFLNQTKSCIGYTLKGALLIWKADADALDFAMTYQSTPISGLPFYTNNSNLSVTHAKFPWKPSFQLLGGLSWQSWDSSLAWTYYKSSGHKSLGTQSSILPLWTTIYPVIMPTELNANYKIELNCIDWEFAKSLSLNKSLFLRPHFGFRGAFLNQRMNVDSFLPNSPPFLSIAADSIRLKNNFHGLGLRMGTDTKYNLASFFAIYANGSISLLTGAFDVKQIETVIAGTDVIPSRSNFGKAAVRSVLQGCLGLELGNNCPGAKFNAKLNVGYQFSYWPNQNQLVRYHVEVEAFNYPGDVIFQGAVIQGALYF